MYHYFSQFNEQQLCLYGWAGSEFIITSERNIIREANKNKTAESDIGPFYIYIPTPPPSQALIFTPTLLRSSDITPSAAFLMVSMSMIAF